MVKKVRKNTKKRIKKAKVKGVKSTKAKELRIEKSRKPKRSIKWDRVIGLLLILGLVMLIIYIPIRNHHKHLETKTVNETIVALVNGQNITLNQLNKEYNFFFFVRGLPEAYKMRISKAQILNQTIDEMLLIQEAHKEGFNVSQAEVNQILERAVNISNRSIENISNLFEENNFTLDDLKSFYWKTLLINKLLNKTIEQKINVSDKQVQSFYNANNISAPYDQVKDKIKEQLINQQRYVLYLNYLDELRKKADIKIFYNKIK